MSRLPVIVGFGGINSAGRSSFHHAYRRLVIDKLATEDARETLTSLASLMGLLKNHQGQWQDAQGNAVTLATYLEEISDTIKSGTLIRQLEENLYQHNHLPYHRNARLHSSNEQALSFTISAKHLPRHAPDNWKVSPNPDQADTFIVEVTDNLDIMLRDYRSSAVQSAGQLPTGFNPQILYPSRNHPRGIQMSLYGVSDAIQSLGIDWDSIRNTVAPDQIAVYAGSSMSQLDYNGNGGLMQARLLGKRVTSKQLPFGMGQMPADFINAYVLGNVGTTGTNLSACATFLYNLKQGMSDIQCGNHRVVIVGTSEAPLTPEIFEGYNGMKALVDDASLLALDQGLNLSSPDYRRACRPFGDNAGFTLAESAQFVVLFDDDLAMELGANVYAGVNDVFVNADGHKKSISSPGIGNYITLAKAAAASKAVIGKQGLQQRSFVQAHGTSTPQNRVTESAIFSQIAKTFGIQNWPVTALKSYVGHSLASASADQLISSLGVWRYGIIPGILTTGTIAEDVTQENLDILLQHKEVGNDGMDCVLLNTKGFGGNNASASILAPHIVAKMLSMKHGQKRYQDYQKANESVQEKARQYDQAACAGETEVTYKFDHKVATADSLTMCQDSLRIADIDIAIDLKLKNNYPDMCDE